MKKLFLILALALAGFYAAPADAQFNGCKAGFCSPQSSGFAGSCAESTAFVARTSGLDATHLTAYNNLICGLVTDGVWAKLDAIYTYATQDSATALLNLKSATYNSTANGSPAFQVDRGFTGVDGSSTVYIDTNFVPSIGTNQYTQNSAHVSVWLVSNISSGSAAIGAIGGGTGGGETTIYPRFTDNNAYFRIQGAGVSGFAIATANGYYVASRLSSGGGVDGYKNGSSVGNTSGASAALPTANIHTLGYYLFPNHIGNANQAAGATIGAGLTSTDDTNLNGRMRTYMTAVGVP